jgi:hypothetical protein
MMFAPLEGWRHVKVTDRHTAVDYAHVLKELADRYFANTKNRVLADTVPRTNGGVMDHLSNVVTFPKKSVQKEPRDDAGLYSYLVIAFGGAVDPEGSAVPLFIAVPVVPDVDVAWSGVGSVFTPGTPVAPPWVACAGVGLVFTPGAPVAPPWAPVAPFCCATAKVLDRTKAVASAIVVSFMLVSSWVERKTNRGVALSSSPCVYRKLKLGRSGDEVRPGWRVN